MKATVAFVQRAAIEFNHLDPEALYALLENVPTRNLVTLREAARDVAARGLIFPADLALIERVVRAEIDRRWEDA